MRGMADVAGFGDIRRMRNWGWRANPRRQTSAYLDLYMLQKERERLLKEATMLARRQQRNQRRLDEIRAQMQSMAGLARSDASGPPPGRRGNGSAHGSKAWKTVPLGY